MMALPPLVRIARESVLQESALSGAVHGAVQKTDSTRKHQGICYILRVFAGFIRGIKRGDGVGAIAGWAI